MISFRNALSSGLKDNPSLFKGVLTGILRVAKEGVFSGLNNLTAYSLLRNEFATSFGFTEAEVASLASEIGEPERLSDIRDWYNRYLFGAEVVYNPWSVLSFLDSADKQLRPYWVSTGSVEIVRDLLFSGPEGLRTEMEELLRGGRGGQEYRGGHRLARHRTRPGCALELPPVLGLPDRRGGACHGR